MLYFELKCLAYIKKDMEFMSSFDTLSKFINYSMCQSPLYEKLHNEENFNNYSFGSFYPIEKDKIYKSAKTYTFTLRSLDETFIDSMQTLLRQNINHPDIQVLQTTKQVKKQFFITELYTITPTIITTKTEDIKSIYWTPRDGDIQTLQKQLQDNLEKKYKNFYKKEITPSQNFIQLLEIKNQKPQSIYFKKANQKTRLFGNKFKIIPNEDETSQKLAFIAMACGLGEKQSYGGGFLVGRGMKI